MVLCIFKEFVLKRWVHFSKSRRKKFFVWRKETFFGASGSASFSITAGSVPLRERYQTRSPRETTIIIGGIMRNHMRVNLVKNFQNLSPHYTSYRIKSVIWIFSPILWIF